MRQVNKQRAFRAAKAGKTEGLEGDGTGATSSESDCQVMAHRAQTHPLRLVGETNPNLTTLLEDGLPSSSALLC